MVIEADGTVCSLFYGDELVGLIRALLSMLSLDREMRLCIQPYEEAVIGIHSKVLKHGSSGSRERWTGGPQCFVFGRMLLIIKKVHFQRSAMV